jgi:hypothetical protein
VGADLLRGTSHVDIDDGGSEIRDDLGGLSHHFWPLSIDLDGYGALGVVVVDEVELLSRAFPKALTGYEFRAGESHATDLSN